MGKACQKAHKKLADASRLGASAGRFWNRSCCQKEQVLCRQRYDVTQLKRERDSIRCDGLRAREVYQLAIFPRTYHRHTFSLRAGSFSFYKDIGLRALLDRM